MGIAARTAPSRESTPRGTVGGLSVTQSVYRALRLRSQCSVQETANCPQGYGPTRHGDRAGDQAREDRSVT